MPTQQITSASQINPVPNSLPSLMNLRGSNNAGTPNTKYDFSADLVLVRNPATDDTYVISNTGTLTNDVSVAGPASAGRDQSGAFSSSSWIHFYFIYNPTSLSLSTISSASLPSVGPSLPSGYTCWAYIGAIRFDGSSHLMSTYMVGSSVFYPSEQIIINAGSATVETSASTAGLVPPNANLFFGKATALYTNSSANVLIQVDLRILSGSNYFDIQPTSQVANIQVRSDGGVVLPNINQNVYYIWTNPAGTTQRALYLICNGYEMPNGSL